MAEYSELPDEETVTDAVDYDTELGGVDSVVDIADTTITDDEDDASRGGNYLDTQRRFTEDAHLLTPTAAAVADSSENYVYSADELRRRQLGYSWRAACAHCTVPKHMRNGRILVIFVLNFIFVTFVWIGVLYKAIYDSAIDYVQHFTNWMWTFAAIFYTLSNISMLMANRFFESILLFGMWWIYFSNVMVVVWLVVVMKWDNPRVLTDEFEVNGGEYHAGEVFTGDFVFHVLPVIYALLHLLFRIPDFIDVFDLYFVPRDPVSMRAPRVRYWKMVTRVVSYLIVLTCIASPLVILTYYNAFDMNHVYEVDTPIYLGILIIAFSIVTAIVAPVVLLSPLGVMSRKQNLRSWSHSMKSPSRADRVKFLKDKEYTRQWRESKEKEQPRSRAS